MACLRHIRYHGVLLQNEIAVDWLSMAMWFGTFSSLGARMRARGLERSLFVVKTSWFRIPEIVTPKKSGWDMVSKTMKHMTEMMYIWTLGWWKHPCGALSHLYERDCGSWEV